MLTKERKKNERRKYFAVHFIAFLFSSQFLFLSCRFFLPFPFLFFSFLSFSSSCYFCLCLFFLSLSSFRFVFPYVPILIPHFPFLIFHSSFSVSLFPFLFFCSSFSVPLFLFLFFCSSFSVPLFLFLFFPFLLLSFFRRVRSTAKAPCRQRQASSQILCQLSQSTISVQSPTRHASLCLLHCRLLCKL